MEINKLNEIIMNDVKNFLATEYGLPLRKEGYYLAHNEDGSEIIINVYTFSATVVDNGKLSVTNYQFLKSLGEIFTYYNFQVKEDGTLIIIQGRCVRDEDNFALMVESAALNNFTSDLSALKIINWPYPYYGITLDETLALIHQKGRFAFEKTEAEYALDIPAEKIFTTMTDLAKTSKEKLDINPSR